MGPGDTGLLVVGYGGVFLAEARLALARCTGAAGQDRVVHGGGAFTAIVASCGAIEADLSERLAYYLGNGQLGRDAAGRIQKKRHLWRRTRRFLREMGTDFADAGLYDRFIALTKLRNHLAHRFAAYLDTTAWPPDLEPCRHLIPYDAGVGLDWTSRVLTEPTARWAVETATAVVAAIATGLPGVPSGMILKTPLFTAEILAIPVTQRSERGSAPADERGGDP